MREAMSTLVELLTTLRPGESVEFLTNVSDLVMMVRVQKRGWDPAYPEPDAKELVTGYDRFVSKRELSHYQAKADALMSFSLEYALRRLRDRFLSPGEVGVDPPLWSKDRVDYGGADSPTIIKPEG